MYAMIGDVRFEMLTSFNSIEESHKANFARHEVLAGRPRLQAMGNDLTALRLSVRLHWMIGNPDTAYDGLLAAKESQQAQAFVYGSGRFVGWFVIESLTERTLIQDSKGRTAARELDVELTEFVGDPNNPLPTPGIGGGQNPLLSLLPESVRGTVNTVVDAVQTGVQIYRAVERQVGEVQTLITRAQEVRDNPTSAFALIGDALSIGGTALGNLSAMPDVGAWVSDAAGVSASTVAGVSEFMLYTGAAGQQLGSAVATIQTGVNTGTIGAWLDTGASVMGQVMDSMDNAARGAQILTGVLATR